ncbi:MAG: ATP-grasp domain-containing protein [Victivallaceae bacterium]|nr:ATP-grasp domain-containing protein [Victivallaceae bacterium]
MKIALAYSSKRGLLKEYLRRFPDSGKDSSDECFAEGDSPATINAVKQAIAGLGHEVRAIEADIGLERKLLRFKPDLVYNIAEGLFGDFRESYAPIVCEKLSLPYTGSGPLALGICLHKARCKEILTANGIANPSFRVFRTGDAIDLSGLKWPVIIKPAAEGSSKGIFDRSVAEDETSAGKLIAETLAQYNQPVILEEFLPGAEFTVAMIGNTPSPEILPIVELDFSQLPGSARKIYSYEAKWVWDTPSAPLRIFHCPAAISDVRRTAIEELAKRAFRTLELRDWCRMDIRLAADGTPNIIEINPIPGILPDPKENSCFPKAARAAGYAYPDIFAKVIQAATCRLSGGAHGAAF